MKPLCFLPLQSGIAVLLCIMLSVQSLSAATKADSLLKVLDKAIQQEKQYTDTKEQRISNLKTALEKTGSSNEKFTIYKKIFDEYEAYICDSAFLYSQLSLQLAQETNNTYWLNEGLFQIASILTISGMYPESIEKLSSIDKSTLTNHQVRNYYTNYYHAYTEWAEYAEYDYSAKYKKLGRIYQDSLLAVLEPNTFEYTIEYAWRYIETAEYEKARQLLFSYLPKVEQNTRQYSIITSITGILYWYLNDIEKHKEYLSLSALSDIKAGIKENTSLRSLSNVLFGEKDLKRASDYINKSMSDANFYNARLRSIQISKSYPLIAGTYELEREQQQNKLELMLTIISILTLLLVITVVGIVIQIRKISRDRKHTLVLNEKLKHNNESLAEANKIKEVYLGRFLSFCSAYIDKMEAYQRSLNKKAKDGNLEELYKMLKSKQFIEDELTEFYHDFDNAFLNIFPNFVEQFNALLLENERVVPKQEEILTTELRIFALIRLGISDSQRIAEFLRYSITTIYNYRSKYRNKSIVPREEFESEIMKITSYRS